MKNRQVSGLPVIITVMIVLLSVLVVSRGTSAADRNLSSLAQSPTAAAVCEPEQLLMVLEPSQDNTLYEVEQDDPMLSNGSGQYLFSGYTNDPSVGVRRGLIAFDLSREILRSATVLSTTLQMNLSRSHFLLPVAVLNYTRFLEIGEKVPPMLFSKKVKEYLLRAVMQPGFTPTMIQSFGINRVETLSLQ